MHCTILNAPFGILRIVADDLTLRQISFSAAKADDPRAAAPFLADHPLLDRAKMQLTEYLAGKRRTFDLPFSLQGTPFQKAVWELVALIPYGETCSYSEIAAQLGNANKARAVGGATGSNPLPLVIPCHRVIGSSGRLTGFAGGLAIKQFLVDLEKKQKFLEEISVGALLRKPGQDECRAEDGLSHGT